MKGLRSPVLLLLPLVFIAGFASAAYVFEIGAVKGTVYPITAGSTFEVKVLGFHQSIDAKAGDTVETEAVFTLIPSQPVKVKLTAKAEGPIASFKIIIYTSDGEYVASLYDWSPTATIEVTDATKYVAKISITFSKDVSEPTPYALILTGTA